MPVFLNVYFQLCKKFIVPLSLKDTYVRTHVDYIITNEEDHFYELKTFETVTSILKNHIKIYLLC